MLDKYILMFKDIPIGDFIYDEGQLPTTLKGSSL